MTYDGTGLLIGEIEKVYAERLQQYARFLTNLGLAPPYQWISGLVCEWSAPANTSATGTHGDSDFQRSRVFVGEHHRGRYLRRQANNDECLVRRETFDLLPL
jgi:hypothetical protein